MVPKSERGSDLTAEKELEENGDGSPHDLAVIRHLLALKIIKHDDRPRTETYEGTSPSDWMKEGTCLACSCGIEGNVCGTGHWLKTLKEQHHQLAIFHGRWSMSDKNEMELIADCHWVTEVNLMTALGFYSMVSSIKSLKRLERSSGLVTSLSVEFFPWALQTEQNIGSRREALENETNLKHSEGYLKTVGSKYLLRSSAAPYCSSKYPTHLLVVDARTQHRLIDHLSLVPKCFRLSKMSGKPHELLTRILS